MNKNTTHVTISKAALTGFLSIVVASVAITSYLAVAISTGQTSAITGRPSDMIPVRASSTSERMRLEEVVSAFGDELIKLEAAQGDVNDMSSTGKPAFSVNNLGDYQVQTQRPR